jgi:hypothetical protein
LKKIDPKVFVALSVLVIGIDYFKDDNFDSADILSGLVAAFIGTVFWALFKEKLGF